MKFNLVVLFFLIFVFESFGQDFQWVQSYSEENELYEIDLKTEVDNDENVYTFGVINKAVFDIDPTTSVEIIDNSSGSAVSDSSLFLTKLDADGNFIWGKTLGGEFRPSFIGSNDKVIEVKIGTDGNIYLLAEVYYNTLFLQKHIAVFKLDQNGNLLMTRKIANLHEPSLYDIYHASSMALDRNNNIFITGSYKNVFKIDTTNPQLHFDNGGDSFLLKIDSNGNILWGRKFDVFFHNDYYESVQVDGNQNPIVVVSTGDDINKIQHGYHLHKIDTNNGNSVWQKFLEDQRPELFNIDAVNNIVISGRERTFGNPMDVDPGANVVMINPVPYLLWLNNNGDFIEVKEYIPRTHATNYRFSQLQFDLDNNAYITGIFNHIFDADPSAGVHELNYICRVSSSSINAFCIKFDSARNFDSAFQLGQYNNNCATIIFSDFRIKNNNQYFVGYFDRDADFDPSSSHYLIPTPLSEHSKRFILKLGTCNLATPVGNPNQSFCASENATIGDLFPNSSSIKWYANSTSTVALNSSNPLVDGQTYYAARKVANCPESLLRLAVVVTINPIPAAPVANNQTFCKSDHATVADIVITGQNIKWYISTTATIPLSTSTILENQNYYASQTINGCESDRKIINVIINDNSAPVALSPQVFCFQQNTTLNDLGVNGLNIKWYDHQISGSHIAATTLVTNGATYYASQSVNGCESVRAAVQVSIENIPAPTGNNIQLFCTAGNPTINDISINGSNITWYSGPTNSLMIANATALTDGMTYYASQRIGNCESMNRLVVTVRLISDLSADNYSTTICDEANDGLENINLANFEDQLIANASNFTFSYYNTYVGAVNETVSELLDPETCPLSIGLRNIHVRISSVNGCHQIVSLNLTLVSKPIIDIPEIVPICSGKSVTLDAGSGFDSYRWSTGSLSQWLTVSEPGNYSLTVNQLHGLIVCTTIKNFEVVLSEVPNVTRIETVDGTDQLNSITVHTDGNSEYEYSIDGKYFQDTTIFEGLVAGDYTVYIRDPNGCGIVEKEVLLLNYPKFFTPNQDGYNDLWDIKPSTNGSDIRITIFDRYGKLLKPSSILSGWDGKFNGKDLPADDYWFILTRVGKSPYYGHFTLRR